MKPQKILMLVGVLIASLGSAHATDLNVFAAASMKNALDEIGITFKSKTGTGIIATYAATGTLAKQIQSAAPADIFIAADEKWMDDLQNKNLIQPNSRKNIAGNHLVLIRAKSNISEKVSQQNYIEKLLHLSVTKEKLAMAEVTSVPAGRYGKASLEKLGIWEDVRESVVMQDNVRSALALVARGEAAFGITYQSDAIVESKVEVVATFPADSHPTILYSAAVVATSANESALDFLDFLSSNEAQSTLLKNGFTLAK